MKTPIRFTIALLKHVVSKTLGDEALQVLADESLGEVLIDGRKPPALLVRIDQAMPFLRARARNRTRKVHGWGIFCSTLNNMTSITSTSTAALSTSTTFYLSGPF